MAAALRRGIKDEVLAPGFRISGVAFDAHTLLVASMCLLLGEQSASFAVMTVAFAIREGLRPPNPRVDRFFRIFTLERGVLLGLLAIASVRRR